MKPSGTVRGRFGGFAAGHFALSFLCLLLWFLLAGSGEFPALPVYAAVPMLLYVPAGYAVSSLRGWPAPDRKTARKAVLYPALCAWAWAFGGWFLLWTAAAAEIPALAYVGLTLLLSTFLLAAPSFLFMLLAVSLALEGDGIWWLWYLCMVLAGLLPPLLFFLGSILPKRQLTSAENVIE